MDLSRAKDAFLLVPLLSLPIVNCWANGFPEPNWQYTTVMLCVCVIEEIFFRGFLFHMLLRYGEQTAVLATSIFFAGMHIANLSSGFECSYIAIQILLAFCVSVSFCAVVLRWGSLLPTIVIHCLINMTASDSLPDQAQYPVFILCGLFYLLYSVRLLYKKEKRTVL